MYCEGEGEGEGDEIIYCLCVGIISRRYTGITNNSERDRARERI